jgi:hypothetical protein
VAFDPVDPQKIAVGTAYHGIFYSVDGGGSWSQSKAVPEPNGGVVGLYFDPQAGPHGENALAAAWGQGLWAISLVPGTLKVAVHPQGAGPDTGATIAGSLSGAVGTPIPGVPLEVRVIDLRVADRNRRNVVRFQAAVLPATPPDDDIEHPSDAPPILLPTITVPQTYLPRPKTLQLPPAPSPKLRDEVVVAFTATDATDGSGAFSIPLPLLGSGRYFIQVRYSGDDRNPTILGGAPLTIQGGGGSDGDDDQQDGD